MVLLWKQYSFVNEAVSSALTRIMKLHTKITNKPPGPFEIPSPLILYCLAMITYAPLLDTSLQFLPTVSSISLEFRWISTQARKPGVCLAFPYKILLHESLNWSTPCCGNSCPMVIIQSCIPREDHTHWTKPPHTSSSLWSLSLPAFQQYLEAVGALTFRLFLTFNSYARYFLMILWSTINQVMVLGSLVPFHLKIQKIWMTGKKDI